MSDTFDETEFVNEFDGVLRDPDCSPISLNISAELHAAGINAALKRFPKLDAQTVGSFDPVSLPPVGAKYVRRRVLQVGQ